MTFNLKENFQNNKTKYAIVLGLIVLVIAAAGFGGHAYYKKQQLAKAAQIAETQAMLAQTGINLNGRPKKPSEYSVGVSYDQAMRSKKPIFALFYADWCGYCVRFMPIFQALSLKYGSDVEFAKINVEDARYEKIVREMGIAGFPTVFILDPKYDNKVLISNAQLGSVENVSKEIDRYLRIRNILDGKSKR